MINLINVLINFFVVHYYLAYVILFLGALSETIIGTGFFIYGEVFFLTGSILAGAGYLNIWLVALACISGGWLGDNSSYWIGRKYGHIVVKKLFKRSNKYLNLNNYRKSKNFFHEHGKKTIFLARFMGPMSWITPFIAGTLKIKYKDFVKYNTPGVIGGISMFLIVGYVFGFSYKIILLKVEKYVLSIVLAILVISTIIVILKKRYSRKEIK